ncbi:hypothetical protein Mapa_004081 [Marchantia paleacea]|nr:hypothetical protein Mapa_004081 [Marchantia paleacea]
MSGFRSLKYTSTPGSVTTLKPVRVPSICNPSRVEGFQNSSSTLVSRNSTALEHRPQRSACFSNSTLGESSSRQQFFTSGLGKEAVGETEGVKMPAAMVDTGFDKFDAVLKAAEVQGSGPLLLLFLADRDSALGKSWCPDCVRAEPVIYRVVDGVEKPVTLLRVYVGDRPTWRNPEHALRNDSRFALKGVPTLIKWENGGITGRLEDHEAHVEEKVRKLVS